MQKSQRELVVLNLIFHGIWIHYGYCCILLYANCILLREIPSSWTVSARSDRSTYLRVSESVFLTTRGGALWMFLHLISMAAMAPAMLPRLSCMNWLCCALLKPSFRPTVRKSFGSRFFANSVSSNSVKLLSELWHAKREKRKFASYVWNMTGVRTSIGGCFVNSWRPLLLDNFV